VSAERARPDPRLTGRIGGLTAWSRHAAETMVAPAHRGFRRRFERLVDPAGALPEAERLARADRARRAHMLTLALRSAEVRRRRAAGKVEAAGTPTPTASVGAESDHDAPS
jgi:hypothetical protein